MLVMILEKAPTSLRGALSRWLIEPKPGVFLGNPSKRVRDQLWINACKKIGPGNVIQIWNAPNPQGYDYRQYGNSLRVLLDFDGLALVNVIKKPPRKPKVDVSPSVDDPSAHLPTQK